MSHKTLIDGTGYNISGGNTLVGGTGYGVSGGKTLIDGTGFNVNFKSATQIRDLPIGTIVYLNVDNTPKEFVLVHKGLPSYPLYDLSCDGAWLMMYNTYTTRQWASSSINYSASDVHNYLNSTFLSKLDSSIQSIVKEVKLPYTSAGGTAVSGENGLVTKVFLPAVREVGFYYGSGSGVAKDGEIWTYFMSTANDGPDTKRIAKTVAGAASNWWTRTGTLASNGSGTMSSYVFGVSSTGDKLYVSLPGYIYIRPTFIISLDTLVDVNGNILA